MSSVWVKTWNMTPRIDCGMCGFPTCASFARMLLVSGTSIEFCPILSLPEFEKKKNELIKIIDKGTKPPPRIVQDLSDGGILFTRPCKDTDEKVMAETRMNNGVQPGQPSRFGFFDRTILCNLVECLSSIFETVKCSRDLGYGRITTGEMSVTILQDGRVNMRRIDNRDQVVNLFEKLERVLMGSIICDCCGCDILSLMADNGEPKIEDSHTILLAGNTFQIEPDVLMNPLTKNKFQAVAGAAADDYIAETRQLRDYLHTQIKVISSRMPEPSNHVNTKKARESLIEILMSPDFQGIESSTLKALAVLQTIDNAIDAISEINTILASSSELDQKIVLDWSVMAEKGILHKETLGDANPSMVLVYAHLRRVSRCIRILQYWNSA